MEPTRIKLYGLFSITRGRYVAQLTAALILAVALLVGWLLMRDAVREQFEGIAAPSVELFLKGWNALPAVVAAIIVLQAVECWFVLRLFRRREAEGKPAPAPPPPGGGEVSPPPGQGV